MSSAQSPTGLQVVARLFWMFIGPMVLALIAINIADNHRGWRAPASIAFLVLLIAVVAARWIDPITSDGNPTTTVHRTRFAAIAATLGLAAWATANWLGTRWLGE